MPKFRPKLVTNHNNPSLTTDKETPDFSQGVVHNSKIDNTIHKLIYI